MQFGTKSSMYAQKLLIHNRRQRKRAKRIHAGFIDPLRIFVFAFEFESEIICEMAAFVVPPKQP